MILHAILLVYIHLPFCKFLSISDGNHIQCYWFNSYCSLSPVVDKRFSIFHLTRNTLKPTLIHAQNRGYSVNTLSKQNSKIKIRNLDIHHFPEPQNHNVLGSLIYHIQKAHSVYHSQRPPH